MTARIVVSLILPTMILCLGLSWRIWPPSMNSFFRGYRTPRAIMSEATFTFAQSYITRSLVWAGAGMFTVTLVTLLLLRNGEQSTFNYVFNQLRIMQALAAITPAVMTEVALSRRFDEHGQPVEMNQDNRE